MPKVAIVGAGITGLTSAYALKERGAEVDVFEKSSKVGGVIQTIHEKGFLIETGPSTLQLNDLRILNLLKELELENEMIDSAPEGQERFIVKQGVPIAVPRSLISFLKSSLFSLQSKLRLLKEPFIKKGNNPEETLEQFVKRRLGNEILDYAIDPFVSGVYAGDAKKLSVRLAFPKLYNLEAHYGSLIKGCFKKKKDPFKIKTRTVSFKNGMHTLPTRLAEILGESIYLDTDIVSISHKEDGWEIAYRHETTIYKNTYDEVVITIPAYQLKDLPFSDEILEELKPLNEIPYSPIAIVSQAFTKESLLHRLNGFGMLIPSKENFKILGTLFSSSMFPEHTPSDCITLRTFLGGSRFSNITKEAFESIKAMTGNDLSKLLKIKKAPIHTHIKLYERAIPQYNVGHEYFLNIMDSIGKRFPGLHIVGNYRTGISLPQCILTGLMITEILNNVEKSNITG